MNNLFRANLLGRTMLAGATALALPAGLMGGAVLLAPGAMAQQAPAATPPADAQAKPEVVIVTGSLIARSDAVTTSPVTVVTEENLEVRGINTTQDAIQQLASNNGPAVTNSFTANGAFAGGASGASLRGLSTNSTLVLFDGLRAAYYPLADDGSRNFVDLNTIPDDIVERIEVLNDGASSTYGADAIAGVINIITKREFQGLSARAETGFSEDGEAQQNRFSVTAGIGDLGVDGLNAYISGYGYTSDLLYAKDTPYPYNSADLSQISFEGTDGFNYVYNGFQSDGSFGGISTSGNFVVRPYVPGPNNTITAIPGRGYENLSADCGPGTKVPLTAAQNPTGLYPADGVCQYDWQNLIGVIQPDIERYGVSGHVSALIGDHSEAYGEVNFVQNTSSYTGFPEAIARNANTGIFYPRFSSSAAFNGANAMSSRILFLPVYVCPERDNCATSPNRTLNPNNPYAAEGNVARIFGRDWLGGTSYDETRNTAYRGAAGVKGTFMGDWAYDVGLTAMHVDLRRQKEGYIYIQHLLDVINDGTFNFVDPAATPQSVRDYLKPPSTTNASSDVVQLQGAVTIPLMDLAGGSLDLAVGASAMYEAVDSPSANSDINGPTQRYFVTNAFGTKGSRRVYSGFFELNAPVLDTLELNLAGRFDDYSSGQSHFSPKVGAKFTPIDMLTLRATYSEGFRIPSFGEANALPTTGFVSNTSTVFNDTYLAQYGCTVATFNACPTYIRSGSYGQTTLASPNLDPEESSSYNLGFVLEPLDGLSVSLDYYNIEKTGAITSASNSPALIAYYAGQPIPAGYAVIPDAPDTNNPGATPRVAFVQSQLVNADTIKTDGYDLSVSYDRDFDGGISYGTTVDIAYIANLSTEFTNGSVERYDGTLGNFNLTAGSGTPKWHGYWTNTVGFSDTFDISGTLNFFGGYNLSAMDQGTGYKDCGLSDGSTPCDVDDYITFDLSGRIYPTENLTVYASLQNVFGELPPIDVITYGAWAYNAVQGGNGILGRYLKVGVKVDF